MSAAESAVNFATQRTQNWSFAVPTGGVILQIDRQTNRPTRRSSRSGHLYSILTIANARAIAAVYVVTFASESHRFYGRPSSGFLMRGESPLVLILSMLGASAFAESCISANFVRSGG
jgi:hypothetical protein